MDATDPAVIEFRELVAEYCEIVESAATLSQDVLVERLRVSVARLLAAAPRLPDVEPSDEAASASIDHDAWSQQFRSLDDALGDAASYWTVFDATAESEPECFLVPLADDLADIWRDLKAPLPALEADRGGEDAVWEWRVSFRSHWGRHAVEALRALHHHATR